MSGAPGGGTGAGGSGMGGTMMQGAPGSGGMANGTAYAGSQAQLGNGQTSSNPAPQGATVPSQGSDGPAAGGTTVGGGVPSEQAPAGGSMPANGGRSSDVVVFVDPLTGQPTTPPRRAPPSNDGSAEAPPPDEADGIQGKRRIRVVPVNGAESGGGPSSGGRESPVPMQAPPRRLAAPRPAWVHGGRDWTIYVECRAADLMLYPSQRTFPLAQAAGDASNNPLIKAIQQMIDRRQSSRRPGEPPYHPQVCLLVRPEYVRTFLTVYPALDALPVPKTRRSLDADDDVISIVTGAIP